MAQSAAPNDLILLWSGGKDAMLTLDVLHSQSPRRVGALLTTIREDDETVTMHGTPLALIEQHAQSLGLPLHVMRIPPEASNDTYEAALEDALKPLLDEGYSTVAAGDLFLEDVKDYRESVLQAAGVTPLFPLWKRDPDWLARHFLRRGYRAIVVSVDTLQLDSSFAGRPYDESFLADLPDDVDPCGEHGAFHTVVVDGPPFQTPLGVTVDGVRGEGRMRYVRLRLEADPPSR